VFNCWQFQSLKERLFPLCPLCVHEARWDPLKGGQLALELSVIVLLIGRQKAHPKMIFAAFAGSGCVGGVLSVYRGLL